jgi:hypothetical protein
VPCIKRLPFGHHGPQDARVLVGQRHGRFLPAVLLAQAMHPARYRVIALVRCPHHRLGTLDEQGAQVRVAPARDAAQVVLAPAGVLPRRQTEPGAKLRAVLELLEVTHGGNDCGGAHGSHAHQGLGACSLLVLPEVRGNALIAPGQVGVEFGPLGLSTLQRHAGNAADLVAGVFQHIGQRQAQGLGPLGEHQAELGQQASDAVDAGRALGLEALAQAVHAQQALLLDGLDGHEVHVGTACRFTDCGGIVGVVLAGLALQPVGRDEVGGDYAGVQTNAAQTACPMVGAGARLHGDEATGWQLGAPEQEFVATEGPARDTLPTGVNRVNLQHALGQIHTDSCNLAHGTSPFNMGFRLTSKTNLGTSMPSPESGKSLRIPLEPTRTGMALGPQGRRSNHRPRGPSATPALAPQLKR